MVRTLAVAALAVLAGCLGPAATSDEPPVEHGVDMSYFESCPRDRDYLLPCEANATNPFYVEVADSWPSHWQCITFADKRFEDSIGGGPYYPWPDWYTLFGPAIADGAGGVEFQMGFAYNTHNDTERVGGVVKLLSEDREELFTFEGPARGFVRIPVAIGGPQLSYVGVLYPATLGAVSDQFAFREDFPGSNVTPRNLLNITGLDVTRSDTHWSSGPYRGAMASPGSNGQFDLVRNLHAEGTTYHLPAIPEFATEFADHSDLQGVANWGVGRGYPYNTTLRHGPVEVEASLQPYMFFGAKFEDVYNPVYTALVHWQCGCYGVPLTTVEGAFCALGVPPPVVTREAGTVRFSVGGLDGDAHQVRGDSNIGTPPGWPQGADPGPSPVRPDP